MHRDCDWAEDALGVIDQPYQFPQVCFSAKINHTLQPGMMVAFFSNLHELNFATKMINDLLKTVRCPPFDRYIVLSAGRNDPERRVLARYLVHLGKPSLLLRRQMNIAAEFSGFDRQTELRVQELDEPVQAVVRGAI